MTVDQFKFIQESQKHVTEQAKFITKESIKNQYRHNLVGLQKLLIKAEKTGKKVNGYTVDQLRSYVAKYTVLAQ